MQEEESNYKLWGGETPSKPLASRSFHLAECKEVLGALYMVENAHFAMDLVETFVSVRQVG